MNNNIQTVFGSGKLGDTIAAMATLYVLHETKNMKFKLYLNATGDPELLEPNALIRGKLGGKPMQFGRKACEFIAPLLKIQPYIEDVVIVDRKEQIPAIDLNLDKFRAHYMDANVRLKTGTNLEFLVKDMVGLPLEHTEQWLFNVQPEIRDKKVCIARSCRYTSAHLWLACNMPRLEKDAFFVGTDFEHDVFKECFDVDLEHVKIDTALQLAQLIAGSDLFISNGTCAYWLAVGLGHKQIVHELGADIYTTLYRQGAPNISYIQGGRMYK